MEFRKPRVTIDLEEYQYLKDAEAKLNSEPDHQLLDFYGELTAQLYENTETRVQAAVHKWLSHKGYSYTIVDCLGGIKKLLLRKNKPTESK